MDRRCREQGRTIPWSPRALEFGWREGKSNRVGKEERRRHGTAAFDGVPNVGVPTRNFPGCGKTHLQVSGGRTNVANVTALVTGPKRAI